MPPADPLLTEAVLAEVRDLIGCPDYGPDRCEVCGWSLAHSEATGCVPDNCCYRPQDGSDEQRRIRTRRKKLALIAAAGRDAAIRAAMMAHRKTLADENPWIEQAFPSEPPLPDMVASLIRSWNNWVAQWKLATSERDALVEENVKLRAEVGIRKSQLADAYESAEDCGRALGLDDGTPAWTDGLWPKIRQRIHTLEGQVAEVRAFVREQQCFCGPFAMCHWCRLADMVKEPS